MSSPQYSVRTRRNFALFLMFFLTPFLALAQEVRIASTDQAPTTTALSSAVLPMPDEAVLANGVETTDASVPLPAAAPAGAEVEAGIAMPVQSGFSSVPRRFHYSLEVIAQAIYDDNINLQHTDRLSDLYFSFDP